MLPFVPPNSPSSLVCPRKNIKELSFPLASGWGGIVGSTSRWQERGRGYEQCSYFLGSLSAKLLRISCALDGISRLFPGCMSILFFPLYSPDCPLALLFPSLGGNVIVACDFLILFPHLFELCCFDCTVLCGGDPDWYSHLAGVAGKCSHSTDVVCLGLPLCHSATVNLFSDQRWFLA